MNVDASGWNTVAVVTIMTANTPTVDGKQFECMRSKQIGMCPCICCVQTAYVFENKTNAIRQTNKNNNNNSYEMPAWFESLLMLNTKSTRCGYFSHWILRDFVFYFPSVIASRCRWSFRTREFEFSRLIGILYFLYSFFIERWQKCGEQSTPLIRLTDPYRSNSNVQCVRWTLDVACAPICST